MLQTMRSNLKGTIAFIIIGILIIPLALVGVEQFGSGSHSTEVATVNGDTIRQQMFDSTFSNQLRANPQANQNVLRERVLEQIVLRKLMQQSAEDGGMTISDQKLNEILSTRYGDNPQGYEREVRSLGLTSASFSDYMKGVTASDQLQAALVNNHFVMPSEIEKIIAIQQQKRDFTWVRLPIAPEEAKVVLTESEISAYYDANKESFLSEAEASFEYIDISPTSFTGSENVKDSEVQAEYQVSLDEAVGNRQKTIAHIFIESDSDGAAEKIKKLEGSLTADNFNELVQKYSDDLFSKEEKGILGVYPQDGLEEFEDGFASLEEGQVSKTAFESDSGSHFFKVVSVGGSSNTPTLEQVKQRLLSEARLAEFEAAVEKLGNAYNADTLKQFAVENNMVAKETELVTRNTMPGPLANPAIVEAAFSEKVTKDKEVSDVIQLQDRAVVVRKIKYKPSKILALEDKRDDIVVALKREKAQLVLKEKSEQLVASLEADTVDSEVTYHKEKGVQRSTSAIDKEIVDKVFTMAKPKPADMEPTTTTALMSNGDMLVVKLSNVDNGTLSDIEKEEREGLESFLLNAYSSGERISWVSEIRSKAEVDIRPATQY